MSRLRVLLWCGLGAGGRIGGARPVKRVGSCGRRAEPAAAAACVCCAPCCSCMAVLSTLPWASLGRLHFQAGSAVHQACASAASLLPPALVHAQAAYLHQPHFGSVTSCTFRIHNGRARITSTRPGSNSSCGWRGIRVWRAPRLQSACAYKLCGAVQAGWIEWIAGRCWVLLGLKWVPRGVGGGHHTRRGGGCAGQRATVRKGQRERQRGRRRTSSAGLARGWWGRD